MLLIEPTPYDISRVSALKAMWRGSIDVLYVGSNLSQPWNIVPSAIQGQVLPKGLLHQLLTMGRAICALGRGDIVHLHGWYPPLMILSMVIARMRGLRTVVESDTSAGQARGFKALIKRLSYPILFLLPSIFVPGGTRPARYLRSFGVPEKKIIIGEMSVDVEKMLAFQKDARDRLKKEAKSYYGFSSLETVVLYMGRLESYKGVTDLLLAFDMLKEAKNIRLLVVGSGSLEGEVVAAAAQNDRIYFAGRLSDTEVWRSYLSADLLVLPSHFEPWGLVVNEAMAFGLPVIVSNRVGCLEDLVDDGNTGYVFPAGDYGELAEKIRACAIDQSRMEEMGALGLALISNWTIENEASNVITAWQRASKS